MIIAMPPNRPISKVPPNVSSLLHGAPTVEALLGKGKSLSMPHPSSQRRRRNSPQWTTSQKLYTAHEENSPKYKPQNIVYHQKKKKKAMERKRGGKNKSSSLSLRMSGGAGKQSFVTQIIQSKQSPGRTGTASGLNRATSSIHLRGPVALQVKGA